MAADPPLPAAFPMRAPPVGERALYTALHDGEIVRFDALDAMAALTAFTRAFVEERLKRVSSAK